MTTPYELRFEIFKHAVYLATERHRLDSESIRYNNTDDRLTPKVMPAFPSFVEITDIAESIRTFVNRND
jgi:hypothetical protein